MLERFAFEEGKMRSGGLALPGPTGRKDRVLSSKRWAVWFGTQNVSNGKYFETKGSGVLFGGRSVAGGSRRRDHLGGKGGRAETVVDVHHRHAGDTGAEHGGKRRFAPGADPVAYRGGHSQQGTAQQSGQHGGQRPLHARHGDDAAGGAQGREMGGKAMQTGHAHIRDQTAVPPPETKRAVGFGGHRDIGRSGRDHQDVPLLRPGGAKFQRAGAAAVRQPLGQEEKTGHGPVAALRESAGQEIPLFRADAGGKDRAAVLMQAGNRAKQRLIAFALGKDHFAQTGAHGSLRIEGESAQTVLKGGLGKLTGSQGRTDLSLRHG